jgi:phosphoenolpyruvate synthase/pyruvate phosphate dikinase
MHTITEVFDLAQAATADRARVGGKAGVLGELAAAGFPVPPGLVVTAGALNIDGWERSLEAAARSLGAPRLAVRSSAAAEDLPNASYAGLYETYLNVPVEGLGEAVRRASPQ